MENNVRKILMDRPLVIPRIIINNYKKLNITEEELIILIFIIDYGVDLEYNPSIFVQELNIDKYKVLELINSLKEKNVLTILIKKENKKLEEMISNLSDEQKNKLALTDVKFVEGKNDEWIQEGMIGEMKDKGYKYAISFMA